MHKRKLIALAASITLVLVVVLSGCSNGGNGGNGGTSVEDKTYRVVNPVGEFIPVETQPLAPRLDTIDDKTIYIIQGEADPVIMPALAEEMPRQYPNTTFVYYQPVSSFGPNAPDETTEAEADGIIRGNGW